MEIVVAVAISILGVVFIGSFIALLLVCRQKYCKQKDYLSDQQGVVNPDAGLVDNMEGPCEHPLGVELGDVAANPSLERVLEDEAWVNDATGLAPHCLAILQTCHNLTEKLVAMTMGNSKQLRSPETLNDLVCIAKRINPRVDDVVKSMYPPLDPRLLEARCTALVLSVSHLVLLTKNACRLSGVLDWIDQSLADVEDHLKVLREASIAHEVSLKHQAQNTYTASDSQPVQHSHIMHQPQQQQPPLHRDNGYNGNMPPNFTAASPGLGVFPGSGPIPDINSSSAV